MKNNMRAYVRHPWQYDPAADIFRGRAAEADAGADASDAGAHVLRGTLLPAPTKRVRERDGVCPGLVSAGGPGAEEVDQREPSNFVCGASALRQEALVAVVAADHERQVGVG